MATPLETFEEACARRTLLYQRCDHCGCVQSYPRALCTRCHRDALAWRTSARRGRIASFTTVHRAANPFFQARVPYVLALVDVDEGFRVMLNIDAPSTTDVPLRIGAEVVIGFALDDDGRTTLRGEAPA